MTGRSVVVAASFSALLVPSFVDADAGTCKAGDAGCSDRVSKMYSLDYDLNSNFPPSAWQGGHGDDAEEQYDLAVVGAGIGAAYLINRMRLDHPELKSKNIALFEKNFEVGGRLQSSYGPGALGHSVQPYHDNLRVAPPEYGGMRIDPARYPLVFHKVQQEWEAVYGRGDPKNGKCDAQLCTTGDPKECCPGMLVPMDVGDVSYRNMDPNASPMLQKARISDQNDLYTLNANGKRTSRYGLDAIETWEKNSGWANCVNLAFGTDHFFNIPGAPELPINLKEAMDMACDPVHCKKVNDKWCNLCRQFNNPGQDVVSCSGYDHDASAISFPDMFGLLKEVVNGDAGTNLYLFQHGFQRFTQGLLYVNSNIGVAPMFGKELMSIEVGDRGIEGTRALATRQQGRFDIVSQKVSPYKSKNDIEKSAVITLKFKDGSVTRANSVYLTMLPLEMTKVDGLQPWSESMANVTNPSLGVKLVVSWGSFSIAKALGLIPCVPGPCQRLIIDGARPEWISRQVWLWDEHSIMFYQVAAADADRPANNMIRMAREQGVGKLVDTVMKQLGAAVGFDLPKPTWARLKPWPKGNLMICWRNLDDQEAQDYSRLIARPFGPEVPVFYGNSEMAGKPDLHGWAEGALEMVEENLPELNEALNGQ